MAAPTIKILINGVDQTRSTRPVGVRTEYQLGARGRAELEVVDDDSYQTAYRPLIDQRLEIRFGTRVLFRGTILSVTDKPLGAPGVGTVTALTAVDDWRAAAQRRVSEYYAAGLSLQQVASDLVSKYLTVYGLYLDPTMPPCMYLPALTFDEVTLEDAFNQLVDISNGFIYRINPTGMVEWFGQMWKTWDPVLSAANKNILGPITWTKSRTTYANRIRMRYGTGLVGGGEYFHGDGVKTRWRTAFPVAQIGTLLYQGPMYPPEGRYETVMPAYDPIWPWYIDAATQELVRVVGAGIPSGGNATVPGVGDVITFQYNIQFPQTVIAETAEAATNPFEAVMERADIFAPDQALEVANAALRKFTAAPRQVTIKTRVAVWNAAVSAYEPIPFLPGDSVRLDIPSRTLPNAIWLVTAVTVDVDEDQQISSTLTLLEASGGAALYSWVDFWRDLAESGSGVGIASGGISTPPHSTGPAPGLPSGGDVSGPGTSTHNALARWNGTLGKSLRNSIVTLSDAGLLTGAVLPGSAGLKLTDINTTHTLQIDYGSDLTAHRQLLLTTGDSNRALALTGNLTVTGTSSIAGTAYVVGGPDVAVADGGTALSSYTSGDLLYATGATTLAKLPIGTADQVLTVVGASPAWKVAPTGGGGTGGGMNLDYLGDYAAGPVYNDGDIVVAADGIAYLCVVDGTTTPPEPWPGVGVAVNATVDASYWVVSGHAALTNERVMGALANGYVKSTGGEPSTVAIIPVTDGGTGASTAATARTNLGVGNVGTLSTNGNANTYLNGTGAWTTPAVSGVPTGAVILMIVPCPPGYTRIGGWDNYYPRFGPTHTSGGSFTHSHGPGSYASQAHTHPAGTLVVDAHTHEAGTLGADPHNHGNVSISISIAGDTGGVGDHQHSFSGTTGGESAGSMVVDAGGDGTMARAPHTHIYSGSTGAGGGHAHSFSGSGSGSGGTSNAGAGVSGDTAAAAPGLSGATGAGGALGIAGVSQEVANNPAYVDFYACRKD